MAKNSQALVMDKKLSSLDWGWVTINIGMGIGAGIVFLPIQAGLVGLWTFLLSILIAYPALYIFQRLFVNTLIEAKECDDYPTIISNYLGKNWGRLLGFIYFIMLIIWLFVYSETMNNDSASYLLQGGITKVNLAHFPLYSLVLIALLVFIAFKSQKLLLNLSKFLVVSILTILVILSLILIPKWDIHNIATLGSMGKMFKDAIITLPFSMTSILFLQSLSPMVIASRQRYSNIEEAKYKCMKIMNWSFGILACIVFFFALSSTLATSHSVAVDAYTNNISFLAVVQKHIPGVVVPTMGIVLDIFAVMTSFFGVLLGFYEACRGLSLSLFYKGKKEHEVNMKKLSRNIIIFIVVVAWLAAASNFPILMFTSICSPIFAIVGCFIPVALVYKVKELHKLKGFTVNITIVTGILLSVSPFLKFLH